MRAALTVWPTHLGTMVGVAEGAREAETAALQAMAAVATDVAVAGAAAAATAAMETMPTTVLTATEAAVIEGAWVLRGGPRANSGGSRAPLFSAHNTPSGRAASVFGTSISDSVWPGSS